MNLFLLSLAFLCQAKPDSSPTQSPKKIAKQWEEQAQKYNGVQKEEIFFAASPYWKQVGDWQALNFYKRYIKKFGDKNPVNTLHAQVEIINIKTRIYPKEIPLETKRLQVLYDQYTASKEVHPALHYHYQNAHIILIEHDIKTLTQKNFAKGTKKDILLQNIDKLKELEDQYKTIIEKCALLRDISNPDATLASYYYEAQAAFALIEKRNSFPTPDWLTKIRNTNSDSEKTAIRAKIQFPIEKYDDMLLSFEKNTTSYKQFAFAQIQKALDTAKTKQEWNMWYAKLNMLRVHQYKNLPETK